MLDDADLLQLQQKNCSESGSKGELWLDISNSQDQRIFHVMVRQHEAVVVSEEHHCPAARPQAKKGIPGRIPSVYPQTQSSRKP